MSPQHFMFLLISKIEIAGSSESITFTV